MDGSGQLQHPPAGRRERPQSLSVHGGEEKNFQPLPALEPPVIQPIAQRYGTELSRLHSDKKSFNIWSELCYKSFNIWNELFSNNKSS